ncbi:MAG: ABC transporter permease [Thermoleophilia bacterium]
MGRFILRRLGFVLVSMLAASVILFLILRVLPGDITAVILGMFATKEAMANLRVELGLDHPLIVQYFSWLAGFVTGDWGTSVVMSAPILDLVMERLGRSLVLAGIALALYAPIGILLGTIAATRRNTWVDHSISIGALSFVGLPEFVTGLVLIYVFALQLQWLPAQSGGDFASGFSLDVRMLILPAITVSLTMIAYITRMTRSSTVEVLQADYVRTAYLKGLPRGKVMRTHVLRNSLLPTVTVIGNSMGWLVGGLVVTETVFGYPGLGRLLVFAIQRRDLPLVMDVVMLIVVVVGIANLMADVIYAWLNPRIAYK